MVSSLWFDVVPLRRRLCEALSNGWLRGGRTCNLFRGRDWLGDWLASAIGCVFVLRLVLLSFLRRLGLVLRLLLKIGVLHGRELRGE